MTELPPKTRNLVDEMNARLLLHCVDGAVPYLTPHLLKKYFAPEEVSEHLMLGIAVRDTCVVPVYPDSPVGGNQKKRKKIDLDKPCGYTFASNWSIHNFFKIPKGYFTVAVPSFDLITDNENRSTVKSSNAGVSIHTPHGQHILSPLLYYEASNGLRCDATIPLYDMALAQEGKRRKRAASDQSHQWLQEHMRLHEKDKEHSPDVWGTIVVGPSCQKERLEQLSSDETKSGLAIIGLDHISSREEHQSLLREIVSKNAKNTNTFVVLTAPLIEQILDAACCGVSVIGTALPSSLATSSKAIGVDIKGWKNPTYPRENSVFPDAEKSACDSGSGVSMSDGCFDLNDALFARDAHPLKAGCSCLACKDNRYSRAYIHHLIQSKELLAKILVFAHILHQLILLVKELSSVRKQGNLSDLSSYLDAQFTTN